MPVWLTWTLVKKVLPYLVGASLILFTVWALIHHGVVKQKEKQALQDAHDIVERVTNANHVETVYDTKIHHIHSATGPSSDAKRRADCFSRVLSSDDPLSETCD